MTRDTILRSVVTRQPGDNKQPQRKRLREQKGQTPRDSSTAVRNHVLWGKAVFTSEVIEKTRHTGVLELTSRGLKILRHPPRLNEEKKQAVVAMLSRPTQVGGAAIGYRNGNGLWSYCP